MEVLKVWSLSDPANPRSSWGTLSPTWDQAQWRPQLSDTKDGVWCTNSKCGHGAKRPLSQERSVLPPYHGGGTRAGCCRGTEGLCQTKVHLKRSCNRERIFGEKTLIPYDTRCIPRACENIWSLSGPTIRTPPQTQGGLSTPFLPAPSSGTGPGAPHPPGGPDNFMGIKSVSLPSPVPGRKPLFASALCGTDP